MRSFLNFSPDGSLSFTRTTIRHIELFIFVVLCTILVGLLQRSEMIFSNILVQDDKSYLVNFLLFDAEATGLSFVYLKFMVQSFGVVGARLFLLVMAALGLGGIACLIFWITRNQFAGIAPLLAFAAPSSESQFVFVNGSHPTSAIPALMLFCWSVLLIWRLRSPVYMTLAGGGAILAAMVAAGLTTLTPGVTLSALIFLFSLSGPPRIKALKTGLILVVALFGPIFWWATSFLSQVGRNHYLDQDGWVEVSGERAYEQLAESFGYLIFDFPFLLIFTTFIVTILCAAGVQSLLRRNSENNFPSLVQPQKNTQILALFFLSVSALCFGPALVVPHMASRYYELPALFAGCAVLVFVFAALPASVRSKFLSVSLGIAVVATLPVVRGKMEEIYGPLIATTRLIERGLDEHIDQLPQNSQIVVVGDQIPFSGFNHWSSGALRLITGRPDVIGLIGSDRMIGPNSPIVESWADHGPQFWSTNDAGVRVRTRMIGLELGRPSFGFRLDLAAGTFEPAELIVYDQGVRLSAKIGESLTPNTHQAVSPLPFCDAASNVSPIVLGTPEFDVQHLPNEEGHQGHVYYADGTEEQTLMARNSEFVGTLTFHPADTDYVRQEFSDNFPPTPILARGWFQLWQMEGDLWVFQSEQASAQLRSESLSLGIAYNPGCGVNINFGGREIFLRDDGQPELSLLIGRGYLQRYWRGEIVGSGHLTLLDDGALAIRREDD